jgi:hypothetical protein
MGQKADVLVLAKLLYYSNVLCKVRLGAYPNSLVNALALFSNCQDKHKTNTLAYSKNESLVESKLNINLILSLQGLNVQLKPFEVKL